MTVTVDRSKVAATNTLAPSALLVQHMLEYASADGPGVQRGIDFLNSVCDRGYVAHHLTGQTFRVQEIENGWATAGNMRGLFDPSSAAVPTMARINKSKKLLVCFGSPKSLSSNPSAANYDFLPIATGKFTANGNQVVKALDEAENRGTPIDGVSIRQELKGQPNRNFGSGGGGQNEVDTFNAIRQAVKAKYPQKDVFGPHLACGGTQNVTDRNRPLLWPWDKDFLTGWMQRAEGWDGCFLDWAVVDQNASSAAAGRNNLDLIAQWQGNWRTLCHDFFALYDSVVGSGHPEKARKLGFIEFYSSYVNLANWAEIPEQAAGAFELATLINLSLGGAGPVFGWQKEGGWDASGGFQHYFGWFRKTAISGGPNAQTGTTYPAGDAVKKIHDFANIGDKLYDVSTGNDKVWGMATDRGTLIVNCGSQAWSDTVEGQSMTLQPYTWKDVPAKVTTPPPVDPPPVTPPPTPPSGTVSMKQTDIDAIKADQKKILASNAGKNVKALATHSLSLLP